MKEDIKELGQLFIIFAKIGGFTFGGGYAMLSLIQEEIVKRHGWATEEEVLDYYAIGQCTPGIIAVNTATFIGYKRKGIAGAAVATLGMIFPSLVIIMAISAFINNFLEIEIVGHIFNGIRVAVTVLIFNAVKDMYKKAVIDKVTLLFAVLSCAVSLWNGASPIMTVLFAAVIGALVKSRGGKRE